MKTIMKTIMKIVNVVGFIAWIFIAFLAIKGESLNQGTVVCACVVASLWFIRNLIEEAN